MILLLCLVLIALLVYRLWPKKHYWEMRSIPAEKIHVWLSTQHVYSEINKVFSAMKSDNHKVVGLYLNWEKELLIIDPSLIPLIDRSPTDDECVCDISNESAPQNFREIFFDSSRYATCMQSFLSGNAEKLFIPISDAFNKGKDIECVKTFSIYLSNVLGIFVFGSECNKIHNSQGEFYRVTKSANKNDIKQLVKKFVQSSFPKVAKKFKIDLYDTATINYFMKTIAESDLTKSEKFSNAHQENLTKFILTLFVSAMEPTALIISYVLLELKQNPDIEAKVHEELGIVLHRYNSTLCYESLNDLVYLNAVIQETLRLYPPRPLVRKMSKMGFAIPGSDIKVEANTNCVIPLMALHQDDEYFKNAKVFDPNRFLHKNSNIETLPNNLFISEESMCGDCIDIKLIIDICKITLAIFLTKFDYELSKETKYPCELIAPNDYLLPKDGIWLKCLSIKTSL